MGKRILREKEGRREGAPAGRNRQMTPDEEVGHRAPPCRQISSRQLPHLAAGEIVASPERRRSARIEGSGLFFHIMDTPLRASGHGGGYRKPTCAILCIISSCYHVFMSHSYQPLDPVPNPKCRLLNTVNSMESQ